MVYWRAVIPAPPEEDGNFGREKKGTATNQTDLKAPNSLDKELQMSIECPADSFSWNSWKGTRGQE